MADHQFRLPVAARKQKAQAGRGRGHIDDELCGVRLAREQGTPQVIGVRPAKTWEGREARGQFWIVTVRVRFDSATISARRPRNASLTPNGRTVAVVDGQGHRYTGSADDLRRPLLPGESYSTQFIIDVPTTATGLLFLLASGDWETKLMIGHENSWLHGKTTFRMGGGS